VETAAVEFRLNAAARNAVAAADDVRKRTRNQSRKIGRAAARLRSLTARYTTAARPHTNYTTLRLFFVPHQPYSIQTL